MLMMIGQRYFALLSSSNHRKNADNADENEFRHGTPGLVGHDPDGHVHTECIALSPVGVKVVLIVAFTLPAV